MRRTLLPFIIVLYTVAFIFSSNFLLPFIKKDYNLFCKFKMEKIRNNISLIFMDYIKLEKNKGIIKSHLYFANKTYYYFIYNNSFSEENQNLLIFIPEGLLRKTNGFWTYNNNTFIITNKINDTYFVFYLRDGIIYKEFIVKEKPIYIIEMECS